MNKRRSDAATRRRRGGRRTVANCRLLTLAAVVVMVLSGGPLVSSARGLDLRPKFKPGRTSRYDIWTQRQQTIAVEAGGQSREMTVQTEMTAEVAWTVDEVHADGSATCSMTFAYLAMKSTGPEGEESVNDTRRLSGDSELAYQSLKAMTGVALKVEVAADGTVQSVSGVEKIAAASPREDAALEEKDFMETANSLAYLPGVPEELEVGGTWPGRFEWNHELGTMAYDTTYTVKQVEAIADIPVVTVHAESRMTLSVDQEKVNPIPNASPMDVRLLEGSDSEQVMFDMQRGEVVGRNASQHTRTSAALTLGGNTLSRVIDEKTQSQVLRIAEEE